MSVASSSPDNNLLDLRTILQSSSCGPMPTRGSVRYKDTVVGAQNVRATMTLMNVRCSQAVCQRFWDSFAIDGGGHDFEKAAKLVAIFLAENYSRESRWIIEDSALSWDNAVISLLEGCNTALRWSSSSQARFFVSGIESITLTCSICVPCDLFSGEQNAVSLFPFNGHIY